jgi:hypothetical protein
MYLRDKEEIMLIRKFVYLLTVFLFVTGSGCSVLTQSQVKGVNTFANAAKNYIDMPGAVIAEHATIREKRQILFASTYTDGDSALNAIKNAVDQRKELTDRGCQVDATMNVLKDYAELLVKLTSDDFTKELQTSSETLANKIDKGIGQYNKIANADLNLFGSSVAAMVRGIGGIYIRGEQEKALKHAIISADPVIQSMTRTVEETMALYLSPDQLKNIEELNPDKGQMGLMPGGILDQEKKEIMNKYKSIVKRYEGKQPPCLAFAVADEIENTDSTVNLAVKVIKAADSFRQAHAVLAKSVLKKQDLPGVIKQIQVLVDEVKAAQELKKKLDNK